ncbi:MAG TPA: single-stranded-DNA-specific exonuclease RecJ [Candidatus Omnitrophota bacterium]|nr:single-stranded-DNA-specific exonuclease RecJ [Candidatus Omnitrophota bacterium]HRZ14991.1 single-stranded-DNA-specific exonuclease RecJ [Candidatus Omnitrophota bacterium]
MPSHKIVRIPSPDLARQDLLHQALGISRLCAQVLINRGISDSDEGRRFLTAAPAYFSDPFSFTEMPVAVKLIKKAIQLNAPILVHGDYDVDGITSLCLVKTTLERMGARVEHYIPHRIREGYGLNKNIVSVVKERGVKLVITVDCGTNSEAQIQALRNENIEVVITDHHEPGKKAHVSSASAVINPKIEGSGFAFRELAGVGVAYKLCQALTGSSLEDDLDLVCLGTIADAVPLIGENRIIAKQGLLRIAATRRLGLKVLMEKSRIAGKKLKTEAVTFILAPRINACGRLDTAETALDLLLARTGEEAELRAGKLEACNRQRQKIEGEIMEEAYALISREVHFKDHTVMVLGKEGWHLGVLGVVASKLADRYHRPVILISMAQGLCRGSGRSIKNFHLFQGVAQCSDLLEGFGGHQHAVGMTIPRENIDTFRHKINDHARQTLMVEDLLPSVDVDMELTLKEMQETFIRELEQLEPFGIGNPRPSFYLRALRLKGQPRILTRETLKFWVTDGKQTAQAIAFGMADMYESLLAANSFDLVVHPKIDSWQEMESVILEVEEIFLK